MALDRSAFAFFKAHAGGCVGLSAVGAANLARAEVEARERGWGCWWVADDDHDRGPEDWGWSEKEIARFWETDHEVYGCVLKDQAGNVLDSLWGIWDPDAADMRVVEAELALSAIADVERERQRTATRTLSLPDQEEAA